MDPGLGKEASVVIGLNKTKQKPPDFRVLSLDG